MTVFGKILVFVNLLFSIIVGALVVMVFVARTKYADELDRTGKRLIVAQTSAEAAREGRVAAETQLADYMKKADADAKEMLAQITAARGEVDLVKGQLAAEKIKVTKFDALVVGAQTDVTRRQADVEKMRAAFKEEIDKNIALVKDNNALRDEATAQGIQAKAFKDINTRMEAQLQDLARDNAKMRANFGATAGAATVRGGKNPPPENVEGQVKIADPNGLVKISIGSDAGLAKGHTLEVFRLAPVSSQSKYLGTIRILEVGATEAVGQPTGRMMAPMAPGDRVASRILGS